ncbi:hypothetical protein M0805_008956 [Coniferiporia weirii]|nr:hypothetical protein M0805_008956 [Coniferiporia weirii]
MSSARKENTPTPSRQGGSMDNTEFDRIFGSPSSAALLTAEGDRPQLMLSPPPEEELRYMRRSNNEPSSASKPLASSVRSNQPPQEPHSSSSKRKRTNAAGRGSPAGSPQGLPSAQEQGNALHTPNPRLRKQGRHAGLSLSPTAAFNPRGDARLLAQDGSPSSRETISAHRVEDALAMSPTRKSHGKAKVLVPQSPHAANPSADYIPPSLLTVTSSGVSVRRRSVTPIPPYEPPKERYTPPREIIGTPIAERKPARRAAAARKKRPQGKGDKPVSQLRIKTEPPEINLKSLPPPASPSEDPILLVGPPAVRVHRPSTPPRVSNRATSLVDFEMDLDLPGNEQRNTSRSVPLISPSPIRSESSIPPVFDFTGMDDDAGGVNNGWTDSSSDDGFGGGPANEVSFGGDFGAGVADDGWSDSDSGNEGEEEEPSMGEGDFTGKFLAFKVPTKLDPPTSETLERMEEWGRPISPHPKRLSLGKTGKEDTGEAVEDGLSGVEDELVLSKDQATRDEGEEIGEKRPGYEDKRGRRLTLSELEAVKFGPKKLPPKHKDGEQEKSIEQEDSLCNQDSSIEQDESMETEASIEDEVLDKEPAVLDNHSGSNEEINQSLLEGHDDEKDAISGQLGDTPHGEVGQVLLDPEVSVPPNGNLSGCETDVATDELESDSDEGAGDLSVIKIMSDDPMAAARAAAILKMHDYDMVARKLKRRRTATDGVSKPYSTPQKMQVWRRRTIAGLTAEAHITDNVALPELLEKAEQELRSSPARSRSGSVAPSSFGSPSRTAHRELQRPASGPREWTKADWKSLDSCFTDERYDLAEEQGLEAGCLASVDNVVFENVVNRFVELSGGAEVVESHGPSWTSEKLLNRVRALCKRQRSGDGAPPTPEVYSRFATPSRYSTLSPSSSMVVPDFTPVTTSRIRLYEKASLPTPSSEPFFKTPYLTSTMPARHSRLRQEVTSSAPGTPQSKSALGLFGFSTPTMAVQDDDSDDESVAQEVETMLTPNTARMQRQTKSGNAVKRSLNYISSWLKPDMFKSKEEQRKGQQFPGLPVPPSDVLSRPRGPVETPAPKPPPKIIPPKELVTLQQAPLPQPSNIPKVSKPQRLVDLQHIPTPQPKPAPAKTISRRSSTASVRDLVKEFEQMDEVKVKAVPPRVAELRKMASVGSLKSKGKPVWRP